MKDKILNLNEEAKNQLQKLGNALQQRKEYEQNILKTKNWLAGAESLLHCDMLGANNNIDILQQQLIKVGVFYIPFTFK